MEIRWSLCVSLGGKRSYAIPSSHVVWQLLKLLLIFIRAGQKQKKVCFYKQDLLRSKLNLPELGGLQNWEKGKNSTKKLIFFFSSHLQMVQETFSLSLPVAGFFLIFIQSIKQMYNIYQFSAQIPAQPKGLFTCRMCVSFYSPQADTWPWVQALADPAGSKGWISCSPKVLSNPIPCLETSSDFTLIDKIGDGIPVLPTPIPLYGIFQEWAPVAPVFENLCRN